MCTGALCCFYAAAERTMSLCTMSQIFLVQTNIYFVYILRCAIKQTTKRKLQKCAQIWYFFAYQNSVSRLHSRWCSTAHGAPWVTPGTRCSRSTRRKCVHVGDGWVPENGKNLKISNRKRAIYGTHAPKGDDDGCWRVGADANANVL